MASAEGLMMAIARIDGLDEDEGGYQVSDDDVGDAVRALIEALRQSAGRLGRAEAQAERAIRLRKDGLTFSQIITSAERPLLLEIATMDLQAIAAAGTRLRRITARALHEEGMSIEQIAKEFGVSRQRASRLLHADPDTPGPSWGRPQDR
jgi:hypothetical protein